MKRSGGKGGGGVNFNMTLSGGGPYRPFQSQLSCSVRDFSFYVSILFNFPLLNVPFPPCFWTCRSGTKKRGLPSKKERLPARALFCYPLCTYVRFAFRLVVGAENLIFFISHLPPFVGEPQKEKNKIKRKVRCALMLRCILFSLGDP